MHFYYKNKDIVNTAKGHSDHRPHFKPPYQYHQHILNFIILIFSHIQILNYITFFPFFYLKDIVIYLSLWNFCCTQQFLKTFFHGSLQRCILLFLDTA